MTKPPLDQESLRALLVKGVQGLSLPLSKDSVQRLLDFLALLVKWNAVYNLTAVRDPNQMVTQHLLDCLAAVPAFEGAQRVLDVGAGGGLPGIVLAIWAAEHQPAMQIAMIDTVHKKTAFLTQAKAELGLTNVAVHTGRVESLNNAGNFDVITSRAFADLGDFVQWSEPLLAKGGRFIAMKGLLSSDEFANLPAGWVVTETRPLHVPQLEATRHLVIVQRATEIAQ